MSCAGRPKGRVGQGLGGRDQPHGALRLAEHQRDSAQAAIGRSAPRAASTVAAGPMPPSIPSAASIRGGGSIGATPCVFAASREAGEVHAPLMARFRRGLK
jgi:hypothetical protein